MWGPFCYFLLHGRAFLFGLANPPYENFCGRPRLQGGSRASSPEIFLCDRNLVIGSGHVLLRFCLKNDKNNDKL